LLVLSVTLPLFTKPDCSVRYSQKPSNRTFPKPDESDPRLRILLLNIHFNIILPSTRSPSKPSLSSSLSNRNPVCVFTLHMRATHIIHHIFHTSFNNNWTLSQFAYATHMPVLRHAHYIDISLQSYQVSHTLQVKLWFYAFQSLYT
jgi:hypothetical protein